MPRSRPPSVAQRLLSPTFWFRAIFTIGALLILERTADSKQWFIGYRYRASQWLDQISLARQPLPSDVRLILIDDASFRASDLAARIPLRADYLAQLIRALDKANAAVIVLDFAHFPKFLDSARQIHTEYRSEVTRLLDTIRDVASRRSIILPVVLQQTDTGSAYIVPDIFEPLRADGTRVTFGHIMRPLDLRAIPLGESLDDGTPLDSLSQAAARERQPHLLKAAGAAGTWREKTLFAWDLIHTEAFLTSFARSSTALMNGNLEGLAHNIVIVGGLWGSYPGGPSVDVFASPIGPAPGVIMHANYVEALLDQRYIIPISHRLHMGIDVMFALLLIVTLAVIGGGLITHILIVSIIGAIILLGAILSSAHLGYFVDWASLSAAVLAHAIIEDWYDGRRSA